MWQKILVGYDGSAGAERALEAALTLARRSGASLALLAVEENLPRFAGTIDEVAGEKQFADEHYGHLLRVAERRAIDAGVPCETLLRVGHAARTIVDVAGEGSFDLIVVGHSGHSGVWAQFLGTTTEKVSRHAPCSVLIVR